MKARRRLIAAAIALALPMNAGNALAWGASGHRMIGQLASQSLPAEIPEFLRTPEASRQIGETAREPDRSRNSGEPHDSDADPAHHIAVADDLKIGRGPLLAALPPTREAYDTVLRANGTNEYRAGYLPYAMIDGWQQLVTDLAYWRADVAGAKYAKTPTERTWFLKDQYLREGLTVRDLGTWAHFIGDASQPQHVSVHSDSWGNYPNPEKFAAAMGLHAKFEGSFVRNSITEPGVSSHMTSYRDCHCTIQQRVSNYLGATQKEVTALYRLDKTNSFDGMHESGQTFVAMRLAAGASELRDLIVDAWHRSAAVSVGYPPIAVADIESGKTNALDSLQGLD
jgi:hypothetical protein